MSAAEFFALKLPGCSLSDAHRATGISYTTIHDLAHSRTGTPRRETVLRLEEWSKVAGVTHAVFISAPKTMGFEPGNEVAQ